jgi:enoyl-CoA hydratase/carnithine racemase
VYEDLRFAVDEHVGVLTLDRPNARNALRRQTYRELEEIVRDLSDSAVRCLVITGADPAFCSGDDVKLLMAGPERPPDDWGAASARLTEPDRSLARRGSLTPAADALLHTDVPVIAAVNGAAVGWGMELALMADLRVASDRARFGELFVLRGLVSDAPGLGRLAQLVGRERAAELLFTGEVIDAATAHDIGLVSRVVPHEQLLDEATALARRIAANPPLAVQTLKRGLRAALDPDWHELGAWVTTNLARLFQTADHREGVAAFLEKRPPNYTGT